MDTIGCEGHDIMAEKLRQRDNQRQQAIEKKREEKELTTSSTEQVGYFIDTFNEKRCEIEAYMDPAQLEMLEKSQLAGHFDKVSKNLQSLQRFLSNSTLFLRVYDIRRAQEGIHALQQRCQDLEDEFLPKKKFGFKIRKTPSDNKKDIFHQKIEDVVDSPTITKVPLSKVLCGLSENICGFTGRVGETLSLSHDVIFKKDVVLSSLEGCTVRLMGAPSTLHMTMLRNCRIMSGPVTTSIFIDNCIDCTFVLACQQLRVHNTRHCDFYLHVTSRAIIEDTVEVRFAPYSWKYEDMAKHFQIAGLDVDRNNWDLVDDFNWLASDKPSPNWHVMKENEQNLDWA